MADLAALHALRIETPRVSLELNVDPDAVRELLALARNGIHDPEEMPFQHPWTDTPEVEFDDQFLAFHRSTAETLGTSAWHAVFIVRARDLGDIVIGCQSLDASKPSGLPETGSWLGRAYQGQGYGTEMRAAVLAFAFGGLGFHAVGSGAFVFNQASQVVSRKFGYVETHRETFAPRGEPIDSIRLRLDRAAWESHRPDVPTTITGLDAARDAFVVAAPGIARS